MIIATSSSVYALSNASTQPDTLHTNLSIRRAVEGQAIYIIALTDGSLLLSTNNGFQQVSTSIPDRIDTLCLLQERPLHLLIGTTPPHVYRLRGDSPVSLCASFEALSVRSQWYTPWGGSSSSSEFSGDN